MGVGVRVPSFAPPRHHIGVDIMQVANSSSEFVMGAKPLERIWTVRLPGHRVDSKLDQMLHNEARRVKVPGFRQGSKVVPPLFRRTNEPRLLEILLYRLIKPDLEARLAEENVAVLPNLEIREHKRLGQEIEVICEFEVRPDIPPPDLAGKELLKPDPIYPEGYLDVVIERIRRQQAKWVTVARVAAEGDRVELALTGAGKPQVIELVPNLPADIKQSLVGVQSGQEVELDLSRLGQDRPAFKATISAVMEPELPEVDLAFARRFMPEAGSVEVFRDSLSQQVRKHTNNMVEQITGMRVLRLLDQATGKFNLPEKTIKVEVQKQREAVVERLRENSKKVSMADVPVDKVRSIVEQKIRNGLIFEGYILREKIKVAPEEVEEIINAEAADHQDPIALRKQIMESKENMSAIYERLLRKHVVNRVMEQINCKSDAMSLEKLDRMFRGQEPDVAMGGESAEQALEQNSVAIGESSRG